MTRRDFEFIARVLATAPVDNDTLGLLADHFTRALAERETSFDRTHFLSTLLQAMTEKNERMTPDRSMRGPSQKLSSRARQLLSGVGSREGTSEERVDLLIRTAQAGAESRERLEAAGAEVRTVAGDVCTASAPLSALDRLAELDDVVSIDVAGELYPEERPQAG